MLNSYRYNFLKCLTFSGEFCNFFSLNNSKCQKVSCLICYLKPQNMPRKKNQSENARKPESGPVAASGCCQNPLRSLEPEENCELRGGVTLQPNFLVLFEGQRIRLGCCGAQSTVPGTSHRSFRFCRFAVLVYFLFFFSFYFWCGFVFIGIISYFLVEKGAAGCRAEVFGAGRWALRKGAGRGTSGKPFRRD